MKKLENKTVEILGRETAYRDLIVTCLNQAPQSGFTREEMKARDRVESQLTIQEDGKMNIEDADYIKLKQCVSEMRWSVRDAHLSAFLDYIDNPE